MKTVYFVRHGESEHNRQKRFAGWTDSALTDLGHNQALSAASRLADCEMIEAVFTSDLIRAKKTAQIIAERLGLEAHATEALRETNLGAWEGLTVEEIEDRDPELLKSWFIDFSNFEYPGGESIADMLTRGNDFIKSVLRDYDTVLIVAHAGIISTLMSQWLFGDTTKTGALRIKNARVQRLVYAGNQWVLDKLNG